MLCTFVAVAVVVVNVVDIVVVVFVIIIVIVVAVDTFPNVSRSPAHGSVKHTTFYSDPI